MEERPLSIQQKAFAVRHETAFTCRRYYDVIKKHIKKKKKNKSGRAEGRQKIAEGITCNDTLESFFILQRYHVSTVEN